MAVFQAPQASLPVDTFEGLLPALTNILKVVYDVGDSEEAQHKLAITAATDALKEKLARAKELVESLPGGEMLLEDQDEPIAALERLRDQRRDHILNFGTKELFSGDVRSITELVEPEPSPPTQTSAGIPMDLENP
ncbi:hypothetical protein FRB96_003538 [Tulasnella sp. 330]|nr:hypothetical protein FRB96_003538 [Tulasnella sp. 330]KAG8879629.1 hypothetical protein FRB98_005593 [Tulasnella sp. 332]KAG8879899.1 hypothetical protein FRB97_001317 [Tulasnella sp. 331]